MKFTITTAIFLLSSIANASRAGILTRADPPNNLVHLQNGPALSASLTCGTKTYSGKDIYLAAQYGVNLAAIGETSGKAKYPHPFNNDDSKGNKLKFPADCPADKNRKEYPLANGKVYNGGKSNSNQGDERVVYYEEPGEIGSDGHPLVYYCGIMTHHGAPTGGFLLC
ncbi:Ribonuclease/ribotoxin [Hypoxylon sp. FL1150]|nr:Ribonuclease/ribotoxin [Hypoxylon sp. FL1150]